jgi:hypothetical protein
VEKPGRPAASAHPKCDHPEKKIHNHSKTIIESSSVDPGSKNGYIPADWSPPPAPKPIIGPTTPYAKERTYHHDQQVHTEFRPPDHDEKEEKE